MTIYYLYTMYIRWYYYTCVVFKFKYVIYFARLTLILIKMWKYNLHHPVLQNAFMGWHMPDPQVLVSTNNIQVWHKSSNQTKCEMSHKVFKERVHLNSPINVLLDMNISLVDYPIIRTSTLIFTPLHRHLIVVFYIKRNTGFNEPILICTFHNKLISLTTRKLMYLIDTVTLC